MSVLETVMQKLGTSEELRALKKKCDDLEHRKKALEEEFMMREKSFAEQKKMLFEQLMLSQKENASLKERLPSDTSPSKIDTASSAPSLSQDEITSLQNQIDEIIPEYKKCKKKKRKTVEAAREINRRKRRIAQ